MPTTRAQKRRSRRKTGEIVNRSVTGQNEAGQGPGISHESLSPTTAGDESVRNDQNEQIDITNNEQNQETDSEQREQQGNAAGADTSNDRQPT